MSPSLATKRAGPCHLFKESFFLDGPSSGIVLGLSEVVDDHPGLQRLCDGGIP